ncbi:SHOCT domain-containing protein [Methanoculleus sp. FWC-SCC1]|uniref:SHOCT domain-containing protein n=1 Tax=Methanoculleus frigidifontis TaxID=2584085 RepID=A0ABT8M6Z4_9EURY|nr:SHOCT domain-containing protein [Methanoculleus sp. FWC-SCC1]MDN7023691.1 SHOCT domain-containing protein [Methanoculleus sp. FWC-SCC1]
MPDPAVPEAVWLFIALGSLLLLLLGLLVWKDAEKRGMRGFYWFVPVALPMVGFLFLFLYLVVRQTDRRGGAESEEEARCMIERWHAEGEISDEEYRAMQEELER